MSYDYGNILETSYNCYVVCMTGKLSHHKKIMHQIEQAIQSYLPAQGVVILTNNDSHSSRNSLLVELPKGSDTETIMKTGQIINVIGQMANDTNLWHDTWGDHHFRTLNKLVINIGQESFVYTRKPN